ncbi:uncharacterized protein LOC110271979 [Arachis ipaensis]|uniref:uncharacterized protein LOC110271979 n=1 Tax=Arachis ipaensis TaxID=130454 RepID=UPI000A2B5D6B|nr:uncharacterized protein LOC110271979 [Arachis ipaensis]
MAARSRQAALDEIQGAYRKQYKRIADYCSELLHANPGSSVTLKVQRSPDFEVEDQHQGLNNYCIFQRVYVCLAACKKSFLQCRKGAVIDSNWVDPNDQMLPIAYAVVEAETKDTWKWFLRLLIDDFGAEVIGKTTFMFDQQKGLLPAFDEVIPGVDYRFCVRHLYSNFRKKIFGLHLKQLMWRCAKATHWKEWEKEMQIIRQINSAAQTYEVVNGLSKFAVDLSAHECSCRKWQLSGIPCTHAISCINYKGLDIDGFIDDCYKKPTYVKCYDSVINPLNGPDFREETNFDDVMPPPYRKPSHRPVKKRKKGPNEPPNSSQSHLSRRGQIQRCSNCGESGHKRGGCKKPSLDAQQPRQTASKRTRGGRKPSSIRPKTISKASSQPAMPSASAGLRRSTRSRVASQPQPATTSFQPNSTHSRSKPTSSSTRPNKKRTRSLTQEPPAPKEKGAASSNQPARPVSFSHKIPLHVSPRKLRLMAKLPPRLWEKL